MMCLMAITLTATSCGNDDDKNQIIDPVGPINFISNCDITSAVPDFHYSTACGQGKVEVVGINDTLATVKLPAFPVNISAEMGGRPFQMSLEIGKMTIDSVKIAKKTPLDSWTGNYRLSKGAFETQAGQYFTKGVSLDGYLYDDDKISVTITYHPGTMMKDVVSTFVTAGK